MNKTVLIFFSLLIMSIFIDCPSQPAEEDKEPILNMTINPVFDYYINRTWEIDSGTVLGYGLTVTGTETTGTTGSAADSDYHDFHKLLFNFNVESLSGASIKSAYFRIYLNSISNSVTPENARLENIFYGNTDSFPNPRNDYNEFIGFTILPSIYETMNVSTAGWKSVDVKSKLQVDIIAGRSNSQFRLTHEIEAGYINYYYCSWNMVDNATNKPELVITYTK